MADYRSLCIKLLIAIDAGNAKAEDYVLCQIRQAVKDEENAIEAGLRRAADKIISTHSS